MINNNSNTSAIIKETVDKYIPGCKVILFGSRVKNISKNDSDYDFLIVTRSTIDIRKKRRLKSLIRKDLAKFKIPADILIQSEEEINSKKEITGHILKQVLQEGVAL